MTLCFVCDICRLGEKKEAEITSNDADNLLFPMTPSWRRLEAIKATTQNLRRLQGNADDSACDAQFLACLKSTDCVDCFIELETKVSRACEQKEKARFGWSFPLPALSLSNARAKLLNY